MKTSRALYLAFLLSIAIFAYSCEDTEVLTENSMDVSNTGNKFKSDSLAPCISECLLSLQYEELSAEEEAHLVLMREEELMAQEVYEYLYSLYNIPVFNNISKSEHSHTLTVKVLLDKYGIPDPAAGHQPGVYQDPEIQELYNTLTEQGSQSLLDALIVGITIEDLDIYDLELCLEDVDNIDVNHVFTNLCKGSRNHMRAFSSHLDNQGYTYAPQYISQEYFNEIISTPWEVGNGICQTCQSLRRSDSNPSGIE